MLNKVLKLEPQDNVLIALTDLRNGEQINFDSQTYTLESDIPVAAGPAFRDRAAVAVCFGFAAADFNRAYVPSKLICSFSYPCSRAQRSKGIVASSSTTGTASPVFVRSMLFK
jgi:hypothetical protein